jgi:hypothetical protein
VHVLLDLDRSVSSFSERGKNRVSTNDRQLFQGYLKLTLCLSAVIALTGLAGCSAASITSPSSATADKSTNSGGSGSGGSNSGTGQSSNLPLEQASAATSFVDSAGVVTHLSYTDTAYYTNFPQILRSLQSLGVRHIRDGYYPWSAGDPIVKNHQQLASAGIMCDYVVPFDTGTTPTAIATLASQVHDMESLEASNECDNAGNCGGDASTGVTNVVSFLPMLSTAAKNLKLPLFGPSFIDPSSYAAAGDLSSEITMNNLHIYFGGRNPGSTGWGDLDSAGNAYGSFSFWLDQAALNAPNAPSVVTETGFLTYPATTTPYTLPESVQASYVPRTMLVAFNHGIRKTFTYELLDEVSSPGYGLLRSDLTPRPGFTALKNLLTVLGDSTTGTFSPTKLQYSITGGDSSLNHLLLQKHDGTFWLVLWIEKPSWDAVNARAISVTPQNLTLQLTNTNTVSSAYQFDTNGNSNSFKPSVSGSSVSFAVSDQITILQIKAR